MDFNHKRICYEGRAVSSNIASIKGKSSLHKFSCLVSQNDNSKESLLTDLGFTEKLRPIYKSFRHRLIYTL